MRILLTGRNGQVGWELERALPALGELIATDRAILDLADPDAIRRAVRDAKPAVIVNAAAYTAVDRAESELEQAMRINGIAPGVLAEEAKRLGALLVHYSTDYVFDGRKGEPYSEDDEPKPINVYGASKLAGERAIKASGCRYLILRASWVYAPRGRNFFLAIAKRAQAQERLRVVDDQTGVPTSAEFLATWTVAILMRPHPDGEGYLYHMVPNGQVTWCGFARSIVALLGLEVDVDAIGTAQYPTPAARPAHSVLDNRRIANVFGFELPSWDALLGSCVRRYRQE